jgi:glycosyltransferase involved in cell wall biosynthesis
MRIAVLTTHPIQYQAPLFRLLDRQPHVQFTALFCDEHGARPSFDGEFGKFIQYDVPLLEGYSHRFLRNFAPRPALSLTGLVNPAIMTSLATGEFDVLVVHGYNVLTNILALLGPRRRTRVLLRGESHLLQGRAIAKRAVKQVLLRTLFARVDHFLPIGTLNRAYYASYGVSDQHMTLAPYSVDNGRFASGSAQARRDPTTARQELGLPVHIPLFLFCAKLVPKKRPIDLLRAFSRVRPQAPCGLVYVGDGALAPELRREVDRLGLGRDVYFLGFRNQSELPAIYGAGDVLVLPSDVEPWGLVVNEAMACGMAVVISDHVGAGPDLVENSRVFPAGDVAALAAILRRLASQPDDLAAAKADASARIARWGLQQTAEGFMRGAEIALGGPVT